MAELHLFNPENDLALAHGHANFTPPRAAAMLHRAAEALPLWYADGEGDCVYAPHTSPQWWQQTARRFGLTARIGSEGSPAPWGWSANAVTQFRAIGCQGPFPDVDRLRELSHRRTALNLHGLLREASLPYPLPPAPLEIKSAEELPADLSPFFIKAPWSGSGRGVADCSVIPQAQSHRIACGVIRRQGSVMLERRLDKMRDFAVLYHSDGHGSVTFSGLSLFFNSQANAYGGNVVASQQLLAAELAAPHMDVTIEAVGKALSALVGHCYRGPLGVDMMLHRNAGGMTVIAPTVEVNLRRTMGHVALSLARFLGDKPTAVFSITPHTVPAPPGAISLLPPDSPFSFLLQ